jgi:hypothetical protein
MGALLLPCTGDAGLAPVSGVARFAPMNCRITPSPPVAATVPDCGWMPPATSRSRVVLPAPLGPTRAAVIPSPMRKLTSSRSVRPSGRTWLT